MNGYIGVTSREWFTNLSSHNEADEFNFWRKDTKNFKSITMGEPFFFLVKNDKRVKGERAVLGMATYIRFEVLTAAVAWDRYRNANGDEDKEIFIGRMNTMFGTDAYTGQIGCIIL